jgi:fructose-bisphosphate aldolase, class II
MGLVNTVDMLNHAEKNSYAVGSFNVVSLEFLNGVLEAAEKMRSPVIISIAEVHFPYINIEQITPAIQQMANNVCVPVVLNLDHGLSFATVVRALRCGFSAVMYDASKKSLEENIAETKMVVQMAHSVGVSVEAELGRVGGAEGGGKARADKKYYTNPDEAERFVSETGIDALAVAVGNAHGFYEAEPQLDFELISTLKRRVGIPLVLHGGSGISDDDFRRAIRLGIRKINFFTEMSKLAADRVRDLLKKSDDYLLNELLLEAKNRIREVVMDRLRVFGSADACTLPGNICPSHCSCGRLGEKSEPVKATVKTAAPVKSSVIPDEKYIADMIAMAVAEVMKKHG